MPLTDSGFEPETQADIFERLQNFLRAKISSKLDLSERTVLGNLVAICADNFEQDQQVLAEAYNALDRDAASADRLAAEASKLGVPRRGARAGLVVVELDLDAAQTYAAGSVEFQVEDEPENLWRNRDDFVSTAAAVYPVVFKSDLVSSLARAPAGTLSVLVTDPNGGINSGSNPADATPGQDIESIDALRVRMAESVAAGGSRTVNAIRAAIVRLDGVLSCQVFENVTNFVDSRGLPAHSIRAVVWDGSPAAASDNEIATAIAETKTEGILSDGSESGTYEDPDSGQLLTFGFARPTVTDFEVSVTIVGVTQADGSTAVVSEDDVKTALLAEANNPEGLPRTPGTGVILNRLARAVLTVPGVEDYSAFTINGATADLPENTLVVYRLLTADITVSGDVE